MIKEFVKSRGYGDDGPKPASPTDVLCQWILASHTCRQLGPNMDGQGHKIDTLNDADAAPVPADAQWFAYINGPQGPQIENAILQVTGAAVDLFQTSQQKPITTNSHVEGDYLPRLRGDGNVDSFYLNQNIGSHTVVDTASTTTVSEVGTKLWTNLRQLSVQ